MRILWHAATCTEIPTTRTFHTSESITADEIICTYFQLQSLTIWLQNKRNEHNMCCWSLPNTVKFNRSGQISKWLCGDRRNFFSLTRITDKRWFFTEKLMISAVTCRGCTIPAITHTFDKDPRFNLKKLRSPTVAMHAVCRPEIPEVSS